MLRRSRSKKAVTVLELVMGLMVTIPIVLVLIDMVLITLASQINDSAAREADRLAASGSPSQAMSRAQRVISRINQNTAGYVSNVQLVSLTFDPPDLINTENSLVPFGGSIRGNVTVKTRVTVTPFLVSFAVGGPFVLEASQLCPISYNVPNTAGGQAVAP